MNLPLVWNVCVRSLVWSRGRILLGWQGATSLLCQVILLLSLSLPHWYSDVTLNLMLICSILVLNYGWRDLLMALCSTPSAGTPYFHLSLIFLLYPHDDLNFPQYLCLDSMQHTCWVLRLSPSNSLTDQGFVLTDAIISLCIFNTIDTGSS